MRFLFCLFLLASAVAPAAKAAPAIQATTVNVLVTDRHGTPLPSAHVMVYGVPDRDGHTNRAGRVLFTDMQAGTYTLRVERDKFITFEKDFAVPGQGGSIPVVAAISPVASLTVRRPWKAPVRDARRP